LVGFACPFGQLTAPLARRLHKGLNIYDAICHGLWGITLQQSPGHPINTKGVNMQIRQCIVIGSVVFQLISVLPNSVAAAGPEISGRASTVIEFYRNGQDKTATPVYQYLMINGLDLDRAGMNFRSYGRLATDLSNEEDVDSQLYYAYLEKKGIVDNLDVKLGRQFLSTTAGASIMDGVLLKYRNLGPFSVSLFGGGDVSYYEGYNAEDLIGGAEIRTTFLKSLGLGLSYLQKRKDSELTHELIGLDADYNYQDRLSLYSEVQVNYLADTISYFHAGLNFHPTPDWSLRTEYLYSLPVFSASSIYSVFATDHYQEAMGEITYRLALGLNSFFRYHHEFYEETSDANVFEAGIEKIRTKNFSGYFSAVLRDDEDGQDLQGFKARGAYLLLENLQCGLGVNINVLERRIDNETDETTSGRYWADVDYAWTRRISTQAILERVTETVHNDYFRGQARLNISF